MMSYITRFLAILATLLFTGFSLYTLVLYTKPVNDHSDYIFVLLYPNKFLLCYSQILSVPSFSGWTAALEI